MRRNKYQRVCRLLLDNRSSLSWPWLSDLKGRGANKKTANKFMLGCILDYQMKASVAWDKARWFAEDELGDPKDLWQTIIAIRRWDSDAIFRRYLLHRFPQGHKRVRRIGKELVEHYNGDARKIWNNQAPDDILERLKVMRVGPQISRMIVGALYDTKQISEAHELKADSHVRKVLGRVFSGDDISADDAHRIANTMIPDTSWKLDEPLYSLGQSICTRTTPDCENCYLCEECKYYDQNA